MKAIQFNFTVPRYLLGKAFRKAAPSLLWSGLSCTSFDEIPEPSLINEEWVKIKTRLGGICGTDLGAVHLDVSTYNEPFHSYPFTLGHENIGTIADIGTKAGDWQVGDRVVIEPVLWCRPRGFADLCKFCAKGEINRCARSNEGTLPPGVMTGLNRDTGGSWSPYFLAHSSQLYRVPETISDENALMIEPFTIGIHSAAQNFPAENETVLIMGAGTIGLCVLAALRALGSQSKIMVIARYPFQAKAAQKLGADIVINGRKSDPYQEVAKHTGADVIKPTLGKRIVTGGTDWSFECVGSEPALDDAIRLTNTGGTVVITGQPGIPKSIDWTAIYRHELTLRAVVNAHHVEPFEGKTWRAFDLAIHLMATGQVDLSWMITHRYHLEDYASAFKDLSKRGKNRAIKAIFTFEEN